MRLRRRPPFPLCSRDPLDSRKPLLLALLTLALYGVVAAQAPTELSTEELRAAIVAIEDAHDVALFYSESDLSAAMALSAIREPAAELGEALRRIAATSTLAVSEIGPGRYLLTHDPSAARVIAEQLAVEGDIRIAESPEAARERVAGTSAAPKPTDRLLIRDEPLYRAFDRMAGVYDVAVVYHPADIPRYFGTVRQGASVIEALGNATDGTNLGYVALAQDTFIVGPPTRLNRAYATAVLAAWRRGEFRSIDDRVEEVLRFRVGPPDLTSRVRGEVDVTGVLVDAETGEPLTGANVLHPATSSGTVAGLDGEFTLRLPTGVQFVELRSVGYVPQPLQLDVYAGGALPTIRLNEGAASLTEVVVSARSEAEALSDRTGGLRRLDLREVGLLPAFTGEPDVLQALTRTAGVTATAEGSAAVSVRGGGLDANLVRQGGIPVLYPAHALGFFPVFHPDLVSGVELYRGYVPASLGGRSASVIDVGWRTGDFARWHAAGSTGPLASRLGVDGPLWKDKVSVVAGGRISHLNWLLAQQRPRDIRRSVVSFADLSVGIAGRWRGGRVDVRGTYADDEFSYGQRFGFAYVNRGARAQVRQQLDPRTNLQAAVTVAEFEGDQLGLGAFPGRFTYSSGLLQEEADISVARELREGFRVTAGALAQRYRSGGRRQVPAEGSPVLPFSFDDPSLEAAVAYGEVDYVPGERWRLQGGLRVLLARSLRPAGPSVRYAGVPQPENAVLNGVTTAEEAFELPAQLQPRLQASYTPAGGSYTLGLAYSRLAQPVHQLSPTVSPTPADIYFTSSEFLPVTTSDILSVTLASDGKRRQGRFTRLGYEFGAYYRRVSDATLALSGEFLRASATPEQSFYTADGFAAGAEAALKYESLKTTVEVSYAYGRSLLRADRRYQALASTTADYVAANTDLPHQISLTYAYRPTGRFTAGLGWTFASGRPFTGIEALVPQGGSFVPVYGRINGQRLPPTHRLDANVNVDNRQTRERGFRMGFGVSLYNVYDRENPFAAFYDTVDQRLRAFQFAIVGEVVPALNINFQWD